MPRACTVCAHAKRAAVEAALAAGDPQREVAARFGLERSALVRHTKSGHAAPRASSGGPPGAPKPNRTRTPKPASPNRTTPRAVEQAIDEQRALELRLAGKGFPAIADALGISPSRAYELVEAGLEKARGTTNDTAAKLRDLEVARVEAIIASFWDRAHDPERSRRRAMIGGVNGVEIDAYDPGQDKAATVLLKAMERRAALLGLDAQAGAGVSITIVQHPSFHAITRAIFEALAPHPDARAAVMARMRAVVAAERGEASLMGP